MERFHYIKTITMMVYDPYQNRLWYHIDDDTANTNTPITSRSADSKYATLPSNYRITNSSPAA